GRYSVWSSCTCPLRARLEAPTSSTTPRCGAGGARLGERRTSHFLSPRSVTPGMAGTRGERQDTGGGRAPGEVHIALTRTVSRAQEDRRGRWGGDRPHCGRDRPPVAAAVRGAASNLTSIMCAPEPVYQKIPS